MVNWTAENNVRFLILTIEEMQVKSKCSPNWANVAARMGTEYTAEACRQKFAKLKKNEGSSLNTQATPASVPSGLTLATNTARTAVTLVHGQTASGSPAPVSVAPRRCAEVRQDKPLNKRPTKRFRASADDSDEIGAIDNVGRAAKATKISAVNSNSSDNSTSGEGNPIEAPVTDDNDAYGEIDHEQFIR